MSDPIDAKQREVLSLGAAALEHLIQDMMPTVDASSFGSRVHDALHCTFVDVPDEELTKEECAIKYRALRLTRQLGEVRDGKPAHFLFVGLLGDLLMTHMENKKKP